MNDKTDSVKSVTPETAKLSAGSLHRMVRPLRAAVEKRIKTENRLIKLAKDDDHREDVSYHRGFVNALLWLVTDCEDKWPNAALCDPARGDAGKPKTL